MSLSKLLNFNLQFQQIHQRQKGLFTFYHEQLNQDQLSRKELFLQSQNIKHQTREEFGLLYGRKSQNIKSKYLFQRIKQSSEHKKQTTKNALTNDKCFPKISTKVLKTKLNMNLNVKNQNIQKCIKLYNFDQQHYFKQRTTNVNTQKEKKLIQLNQFEKKAESLHSNSKKSTILKKQSKHITGHYVFPIFDQNSQQKIRKNSTTQQRKFRNKTKIQQSNKKSMILQKSNNLNNLSLHIAQSQNYQKLTNINKQLKITHQQSYVFHQMPNIRKKSETLTNRLRSYMKNQQNQRKDAGKVTQDKIKNIQNRNKENILAQQDIKSYKYQQKLKEELTGKIKRQKLRA